MGSSRIRLVVGLGNPGPQYQRTRHNAGFWLVEELARRHGGIFRSEQRGQCDALEIAVGGFSVHLLKPLLFMNRSGSPVQTYARYRNILPQEIVVAHDELDFPPGVVRLKVGGGHGGHNGVRDLIAVFGTADFVRIRLGIGRAPSSDRGAAHVLAKPSPGDESAIRAAIDRAVDCLPQLVAGDIAAAMAALNTRGDA